MRSLITGIHGQDGYYLTQHLLGLGYEVYGLDPYRPEPRSLDVPMVPGDLLDMGSLIRAIETVQPDEVYNLGAQTFVGGSWVQPGLTCQVNGLGVVNLLEAIRTVDDGIKFYQASTSEMFGNAPSPQNEETPFHPRSPYGAAKLYAHWMTINYRESYGMKTYTGILFNHESPRRGKQFVTRKVCDAAKAGQPVVLGNLEARRDWGYAGNYVRAMHQMLQREPDDYVIATGKMHSVEDLARIAYEFVGLDWRDYVTVSEEFNRPAELYELCGDASKAKTKLGWGPTVSFEELIEMMVS